MTTLTLVSEARRGGIIDYPFSLNTLCLLCLDIPVDRPDTRRLSGCAGPTCLFLGHTL